jgi:hypothetical protein
LYPKILYNYIIREKEKGEKKMAKGIDIGRDKRWERTFKTKDFEMIKQNEKRIKRLLEDLRKEFTGREDYVNEFDRVKDDAKYFQFKGNITIARGREFSIELNKEGFLKMETSYSNQIITPSWIEKLQNTYKIVDEFNTETVEDSYLK